MESSLAAAELGLTEVQYKHMCAVATRAFESGAGESVALVWSAVGAGGRGIIGGGFSWLANVAPWPEVRFSVDGLEIKRAIKDLIERYGESVSITALWHSHQRSAEPSSVDVREFPSWLTERGAIYVVQGGETIFYSGDIINPAGSEDKLEDEVIE